MSSLHPKGISSELNQIPDGRDEEDEEDEGDADDNDDDDEEEEEEVDFIDEANSDAPYTIFEDVSDEDAFDL